MKSKILFTLLTLGTGLLAGCSDSQSSRVYTVDELMADEPLLQKLYSECKENYGEIGNTQNCANAFQANHHMKLNEAIKKLEN